MCTKPSPAKNLPSYNQACSCASISASKIPRVKGGVGCGGVEQRRCCTLRAMIWLNSRSSALHTSPYVPDPMCPCNLYLGPTATKKKGAIMKRESRQQI